MKWTNEISVAEMLSDDRRICLCFIHEAGLQARREGVLFGINPETYIDDCFDGVHPTQEELLDFLEEKGFDKRRIKETLIEDFESLIDDRKKYKADAEKFFELFQAEWHVQQKDIEKLVNSNSIYYLLELVVANAATTKARLLAKKRHVENHAMKAKVFVWCDENMHRFSSMDDAALDIAETFVSQKFRAVRTWMTEWKKLQSAGTL